MKRLLIALKALLLTGYALLLSGCFYLVENGKGGVAERYPISYQKIELHQRLHRCEAAISQQHVDGKAKTFPAHYQQAKNLVVISRRLYTAEFYLQAQLTLEKAEKLLHALDNKKSMNTVTWDCEHMTTREICL